MLIVRMFAFSIILFIIIFFSTKTHTHTNEFKDTFYELKMHHIHRILVLKSFFFGINNVFKKKTKNTTHKKTTPTYHSC